MTDASGLPRERACTPARRRARSRHHVVRRGRRRVGEDDGAWSSGSVRSSSRASTSRDDRRDHLHREGRGRAALRCATARRRRRSRPPASASRSRPSSGTRRCRRCHAFARRLLTEHGLAVGVPPRFDVLDEVGEAIELEARWRALAARLFDETATLAPVVARAVELGLTPKRPPRDHVFRSRRSYDRLRERSRGCVGGDR